jgi:hypothetical protein
MIDIWEAKTLLNDYADRREKLTESACRYDETIAKRYAEAIILNQSHIGFVMPKEMIWDWIKKEYIISYDGMGYWLNEEGERMLPITFKEEEPPKKAVFGCWYNK